ncbi:hypothetical protein [uncultured Psychroserpens sp.]|uniref:hypothetical protein n=1 Tax=uncultured Psychroserpens sp. TaxID=255436 RepID=UPI0026223DBD|nr:hypothetical protein [uncultured Psychroserpens sp.]
MKKLILIALAFVSVQAFAQNKEKKELKEAKKAKIDMRHDMSAEDMATISTKKMTLALDLSDQQQVQVKKLMLEQAETLKAKRDKREKMGKEKGDKKIAKEERVKILNEKLDHQIEMKKKMKSILTSEQYEKWEKMQSRRHHKMKGKAKKKSKH